MVKTIKIKMALVAMVAGIALLAVQCKKPEPQAKSFHGVFTFTKGEVLKNGTLAKAGDKILGADKIEVKDKAMAVIQFAADAQLTLSAGTTITMDDLSKGADGKVKINVNQESGTSFSKVLAKGSDYKVSTPTLVAGVRGTSFSVTLDRSNPKRVVIKLLEGKVQASSTAPETAGQSVVVEAGQKLEATESQIAAPATLSVAEKTSLEKLNQIAMVNVDKLEEITPADVSEAGQPVAVPVIEIPSDTLDSLTSDKPSAPATATQAEPKRMTLEDLKKTYGRLSKVVTKDGKEYIGSFQQKDSFIIMTTVNGTVKIPVNDVAKISPFQG